MARVDYEIIGFAVLSEKRIKEGGIMSNAERAEMSAKFYRQYHPAAGPGVYVADVVGIADEVFPDFPVLGHEYFFADVMSRGGLSIRERNMIIIAVLQAIQFSGTKGHMRYAIQIGTSREEAVQVIMHAAPVAGWPVGDEFFSLIEEVYPGFLKADREESLESIRSRNLLSARERSMISMAALLTRRFYRRLEAEICHALDIGISRGEILELILQATPFAGWPAGVGAISVARDAFSLRERR